MAGGAGPAKGRDWDVGPYNGKGPGRGGGGCNIGWVGAMEKGSLREKDVKVTFGYRVFRHRDELSRGCQVRCQGIC